MARRKGCWCRGVELPRSSTKKGPKKRGRPPRKYFNHLGKSSFPQNLTNKVGHIFLNVSISSDLDPAALKLGLLESPRPGLLNHAKQHALPVVGRDCWLFDSERRLLCDFRSGLVNFSHESWSGTMSGPGPGSLGVRSTSSRLPSKTGNLL